MKISECIQNVFGYVTWSAATVYLYTLQFFMSLVYLIVHLLRNLVILPVKRLLNATVLAPSKIILRNLVELALLPVNLPLYIFFGSSVSALYRNIDIDASIYGIVLLSQYLLSTLLLGVFMGVVTGLILSSFHKFIPIPNIYWELSLRKSILDPIKYRIKVYNLKKLFSTGDRTPNFAKRSDGKRESQCGTSPHLDAGNITPKSIAHSEETFEDDDDDTSDMSRIWEEYQPYASDTVRTDLTDYTNRLVFRGKMKNEADLQSAVSDIDIKNI